MTPSLARLPATELLAGYRAGRFTPAEAVEETIAALARTHAACNVIVTDLFAEARAEAAKATGAWRGGTASGRLAGVPVTVKDLVFVGGVAYRAGSPATEGYVAPADAAVVAWLRREGAVLTCKTTTCESGYKLTADNPVTGITRNPWRRDRTSGGSSGGAAASVAAGAGPLAVGTDGVGSIRVPAAFCGVVGVKPTFGLVPRAPGYAPPSWASLAHTGPIARTVADAALLLEVMAGYDQRDAASLPQPPRRFDVTPGKLTGLRLAASADLGYAAVAPAVRAAFARALGVLADLGAEVTEDHPGLDPDTLTTTLRPIALTEQAAAAAGRDAASLALSDPDYAEVVAWGRQVGGVDYVAAGYRRAALRNRFVDLFRRADALVTPTVATTAFPAGDIGVAEIDGRAVDRHLGWSPFSWPINLAGLPACTLPCGFDPDGLPIGLQIVGRWLDEPLILRIAAAFEQAAPWAEHWPQMAAGGA